MDLGDFFQVIRRHLVVFITVIVVCLAISYAYTAKENSQFESYASFYVARVGGGNDQYGGFYAIQADGLASDNFVSWLRSSPVVGEIYQKAGISTNNQDLVKLGKKFNLKNQSADNIELRFVNDNEQDARGLINAAAEVINTQKQAVITRKSVGERYVDLNSDPVVHARPVDKRLNYGIGLLSALVLGFILVYLIHFLGGSIDYFQQARRVLGRGLNYLVVSRLAMTNWVKNGEVAEKFRMLRENLLAESNAKLVILVAGIGSGDSLSIASNLAKSFAAVDKKVLLIDANLSEPQMRGELEMKKKAGLADFLAGKNKLVEVINELPHYRMSLISAGQVDEDSADLLAKLNQSAITDQLTASASVVIFASANLPKYADAVSIFPKADKVVLFGRLGGMTKAEAKEVRALMASRDIKPEIVVVS